MDGVFRPLRRIEDCMAADFQQELSLYEMERVAAEARRVAWEAEVRAATTGDGPSPPMPGSAVIPEEPERPRLQVADATVEKLGALSAALPRGLLLVRDELAGWFGAFDKYGGGGSDRAFAIEMYGGRSYTVDRMKSRKPLCIRHLSIGVIGGIQPDKLADVLDGPDDGLTSRFLWVFPDALPRFKLAREAADDSAAQEALEQLSNLPMGQTPTAIQSPSSSVSHGLPRMSWSNSGRQWRRGAMRLAGLLPVLSERRGGTLYGLQPFSNSRGGPGSADRSRP
jgi:hypothetical protein